METKSCSRSNENPMKRFLLLVVHFCTFINQEENMSRTLLKAALALVLLWILVACWSLGGAITETSPLCCGETQLSRSEREDHYHCFNHLLYHQHNHNYNHQLNHNQRYFNNHMLYHQHNHNHNHQHNHNQRYFKLISDGAVAM